MLIQLREAALNRLFNIPAGEVLNPNPSSTPSTDTLSLVRMVKQAINEFKSEAIDSVSGLVDYQKLCNSPCYTRYQTELIPQLHQLDFSALTDIAKATSFWINLYNALTLHAVIEYGITDSIASGGFGDQVRFFRRAAYNLGGMRFSLEDIEHGVLRANAGNPFQFSPQIAANDPRSACILRPVDPRVHFALNCASNSCPPIGVYEPEHLAGQLDLASAYYIANETEIREGQLHISRLFSWYRQDFDGRDGIRNFLLSYLPDDDRKEWLLAHPRPPFKYLPYDWGLNKINS